MIIIEERADDTLEKLTSNTVNNVSFIVRDKRLELLLSKLIFTNFTFLGCRIILSLGCDGEIEVEIVSNVS
ncbi:9056_t:CDS:1, partial [Funneliformis caledonium]